MELKIWNARRRSRLRKKILKRVLGTKNLKLSLRCIDIFSTEDPLLKFGQKFNPHLRRQQITCTKVRSKQKSEDVHEDEEFRDSSTFLKGTQSLNPHNDYSQHFVNSGQRPQNAIRDYGPELRFEKYPKLKEFIKLKDELVKSTAHPPMYWRNSLRNAKLSTSLVNHRSGLPSLFDVIMIEPPLEEYTRSYSGLSSMTCQNNEFWSWKDIMSLDIGKITAHRSFVFLWCGSSEGLELGRSCLQAWGFRRCEDICWVLTNNKGQNSQPMLNPNGVLQRTKQHCLMGIKGTVRRSTDGNFIHANVDIDLILSEEADSNDGGYLEKPSEIFDMIEHFCLGRRRLHLFGGDATIRPGWLTVGPRLSMSNYDGGVYSSYFPTPTSLTTGSTQIIENMRPKTPPSLSQQSNMATSSFSSSNSLQF